MRLSIQIQNSPHWEDNEKHYFDFTEWKDAVIFAYRLALIHKKQIRIEKNGNGSYFWAEYAPRYFKSIGLTENTTA